MESITVYLNSSVAGTAAATPVVKFKELNQLARKESVEIIFFKDYCRVIGKTNRKIKVPKKITASSKELLMWVENKIMTAWK